jgi:L-alanine-DL-glutamate epimerase-like enolase superfamily enzyme
MSSKKRTGISRRSLLKTAAAVSAFGPLFQATQGELSAQARRNGPNRNSSPSDLKITDIRGVTIASNYDYPIIRIDTNQDVYGLGEVFCNDMISQALLLKPFVVGRNPLEIDAILTGASSTGSGIGGGGGYLGAGIRRFASQGSSSSGYSAIDIALHDLAGKVYGVPAWRLLGDKLRDRLLIYCDTTGISDPRIYGERMRRRQRDGGFQFFKMDLYTTMVADKKDAVDARGVATDLGLKYMCQIIQGVRDGIGWEPPLAADHFGRLTVKDAIRYARAFEPYHLAWAEDLISALDWRGFREITHATTTPTCTGENLFGLEGFKPLIDNDAVNILHPDVTDSGGMIECKRIADYAASSNVPCAVHMANSPLGQLASAHFAATIPNFMVLEYHAVDIPWWQDLVTGVKKPIIEHGGYQTVPDTPGLGVELNEAVVKEHLVTTGYPVPDGYFAPTPMYDKAMIGNHVRSKYPHLDAQGNPVNDLDENTGPVQTGRGQK